MFRELVFLCIGSDRITGDSLGPLIGYQLSPYCSRIFHVYGTLDDPVHALNLPDRISYIHSRHPEALLVAIDASLGSRRHQGYITIGNGAIRPGAGAGKTLPVGRGYFYHRHCECIGQFSNSFFCRQPGLPRFSIWRNPSRRESCSPAGNLRRRDKRTLL